MPLSLVQMAPRRDWTIGRLFIQSLCSEEFMRSADEYHPAPGSGVRRGRAARPVQPGRRAVARDAVGALDADPGAGGAAGATAVRPAHADGAIDGGGRRVP